MDTFKGAWLLLTKSSRGFDSPEVWTFYVFLLASVTYHALQILESTLHPLLCLL